MLALIAGQGALPNALISALPEPPVVAALERFPPRITPDIVFRIEHLGSFLAELKSMGITEVVFAGSLKRVPLDASRIDAATRPLVPRMMAALQKGDDAALRTVLDFFEEAGFAIQAPHVIAPDLLPESGPLGALDPDHDLTRDVSRARSVLRAMGQADIGQACVVRGGQVLAVEGSFGTDWMLASLANRPDDGGGVLFKAPKPDQDRRVDLPVIGPETIAGAIAARVAGIVIEEGGVMVLNRAEMIKKADEAGLFVLVEPAIP